MGVPLYYFGLVEMQRIEFRDDTVTHVKNQFLAGGIHVPGHMPMPEEMASSGAPLSDTFVTFAKKAWLALGEAARTEAPTACMDTTPSKIRKAAVDTQKKTSPPDYNAIAAVHIDAEAMVPTAKRYRLTNKN